MVRFGDTIFCDGCGVELLWAPVLQEDRLYCCADCRDGKQCQCSQDDEEERRASSTSAAAEIA